MPDEISMVLKMLQDGKITPEQAEALIKALPAAKPEGSGPGLAPDADGIDHVQVKLSELQNKLSDIQFKLGTAQASAFDQVKATLADIDLRPVIEDTSRTLAAVKTEVVRSAKLAARFATRQARRISTEARAAGQRIADEYRLDLARMARPANSGRLEETADTLTSSAPASAGTHISIVNPFGNVRVTQSASPVVKLTAHKAAWGGGAQDRVRRLSEIRIAGPENPESHSRLRLYATCAGPADDFTVDFEVEAPTGVVLSIETGFGEITVDGVTAQFAHIESLTGNIALNGVTHPDERQSAVCRSKAGSIAVDGYAGGPLTCELLWDQLSGAHPGRAELTMKSVKSSGNVSARSIAGPISLQQIESAQAVKVSSTSGDISLDHIDCASAAAASITGDITADRVETTNDKLALTTTSGDIVARETLSEAVTIGSISGDAQLHFAGPVIRSVGASTVSGDITVTLSENCGPEIELRTTSGKLACGLAITLKPGSDGRVLAGTVGDGKGSIKLQSVSGDLSVG